MLRHNAIELLEKSRYFLVQPSGSGDSLLWFSQHQTDIFCGMLPFDAAVSIHSHIEKLNCVKLTLAAEGVLGKRKVANPS